jgi:glycine cleavage system H protein
MSVPDNLKYAKTHEWASIEDDLVTMGITDHAQHELTDIVYIDDFPDVGSEVTKGQVIAVVESVKAVSDVYAPVSGTLEAINEDLATAPESLNSAPYDAWIAKIRCTSPEDIDSLLSAEDYSALIAE